MSKRRKQRETKSETKNHDDETPVISKASRHAMDRILPSVVYRLVFSFLTLDEAANMGAINRYTHNQVILFIHQLRVVEVQCSPKGTNIGMRFLCNHAHSLVELRVKSLCNNHRRYILCIQKEVCKLLKRVRSTIQVFEVQSRIFSISTLNVLKTCSKLVSLDTRLFSNMNAEIEKFITENDVGEIWPVLTRLILSINNPAFDLFLDRLIPLQSIDINFCELSNVWGHLQRHRTTLVRLTMSLYGDCHVLDMLNNITGTFDKLVEITIKHFDGKFSIKVEQPAVWNMPYVESLSVDTNVSADICGRELRHVQIPCMNLNQLLFILEHSPNLSYLHTSLDTEESYESFGPEFRRLKDMIVHGAGRLIRDFNVSDGPNESIFNTEIMSLIALHWTQLETFTIYQCYPLLSTVRSFLKLANLTTYNVTTSMCGDDLNGKDEDKSPITIESKLMTLVVNHIYRASLFDTVSFPRVTGVGFTEVSNDVVLSALGRMPRLEICRIENVYDPVCASTPCDIPQCLNVSELIFLSDTNSTLDNHHILIMLLSIMPNISTLYISIPSMSVSSLNYLQTWSTRLPRLTNLHICSGFTVKEHHTAIFQLVGAFSSVTKFYCSEGTINKKVDEILARR